jgi:hypothetical protein
MFVLLIFVRSCTPSYCFYESCSDQNGAMSWCITSHHEGRHHHTLICVANIFKLFTQSKTDSVQLLLCNVYCRHCQQKANMLKLGSQCLACVVLMSVTGGAGNWFLCSVPCTFLLRNVSKFCGVWWKAGRLEIMKNEKLSNWLNRKFKKHETCFSCLRTVAAMRTGLCLQREVSVSVSDTNRHLARWDISVLVWQHSHSCKQLVPKF